MLKMKAKYDRRQMVRLICEGLSSYQIAARLHITPSTVRKATRQLKQQQAGTYKATGREFYSERLIDLVPKTTKLDAAKSATVKANRLDLTDRGGSPCEVLTLWGADQRQHLMRSEKR